MPRGELPRPAVDGQLDDVPRGGLPPEQAARGGGDLIPPMRLKQAPSVPGNVMQGVEGNARAGGLGAFPQDDLPEPAFQLLRDAGDDRGGDRVDGLAGVPARAPPAASPRDARNPSPRRSRHSAASAEQAVFPDLPEEALIDVGDITHVRRHRRAGVPFEVPVEGAVDHEGAPRGAGQNVASHQFGSRRPEVAADPVSVHTQPLPLWQRLALRFPIEVQEIEAEEPAHLPGRRRDEGISPDDQSAQVILVQPHEQGQAQIEKAAVASAGPGREGAPWGSGEP